MKLACLKLSATNCHDDKKEYIYHEEKAGLQKYFKYDLQDNWSQDVIESPGKSGAWVGIFCQNSFSKLKNA